MVKFFQNEQQKRMTNKKSKPMQNKSLAGKKWGDKNDQIT